MKFIFACFNVCYLERIIQGIIWLRCEADLFHVFSPCENIRALDYKPNLIPSGKVDSQEKIGKSRITETWDTMCFSLHFLEKKGL